MQNKPNFFIAAMFLSLLPTKDYENENTLTLRQNKADQTQFMP
jgi:hypothetical protein